MPNDQATKETKILDDIADILFGAHANITYAHSSGKITEERMRLLMESPYWRHIQPQSIEKKITKKSYQPTPEENKSLESLCQYIEGQIQILCKKGTVLAVLNSAEARKRKSSKNKAYGILKENQNQVERYLTVLRGVFNDPPEPATPTDSYPNPFRIVGIATYSYRSTRYSLRLIMAATWCAASDKNADEWIHASENKEEMLKNSKENFISVLEECLRAHSKNKLSNPYGNPDSPSCELGTAERLLLRGAPFNKCFAIDQQDKLSEIKHSIDHYLIDKLENFCTKSDKILMFLVLMSKCDIVEPNASSDKTYMSMFERYKDSLILKRETEAKALYAYLEKSLDGFPWQAKFSANMNLKTFLFRLLETRIGIMTSIEPSDVHGLMNPENENIRNRLINLGSHSLVNDIWIENYQNIDEAKEFEQDRITLKALEELIDAEDCRCALAPGLFNTKKTQQRFEKLWSEYQEKANQFTDSRGENIKDQIDQLTKDTLKREFALEVTYDTRLIIEYTLKSINARLRRLEKKFFEFTPELIDAHYQASLETLWDSEHPSTQEEALLSIAPRGIRLNQERYQQLDEKQKKQLAWGLHIAKLAASFEPTKEHINRERDILRGIAAMLGQTLDSAEFEAETFGQERDHFLKEDIEDVIWVACSIIRELDISTEQKKISWSTLEKACKNIDFFSRHISFSAVMEGLKDFIKKYKDTNIWQGLPDLFTNLEEAQIELNSDWTQYARPLYQLLDLQGLVFLSLVHFMSALKLEKLHLANKQCFSLWCRVFKGNYADFNQDEKRVFESLPKENKNIKYTVNGLGEFLQEVIQLVNQNEKFHASFAEGIITNMTRSRSEQLVNIVACFTKKPILCPRLSSSLPGKIVLTTLANLEDPTSDTIAHEGPLRIGQYYDILNQGSYAKYQNAHIIIPGGDFDHKKILKEQKVNYTKALNPYVKPSGSSSLEVVLQKLNKYAPPTYSNLPSNSAFFQSVQMISHQRENLKEGYDQAK